MNSPIKFQEEFLTCGICFDIFKEPKVLPCLHTFCQSCLNSFITTTTLLDRRTAFQCPTCRELVHAPRPSESNWAAQFRDNFYVKNLIDANYKQPETAVPSDEKPCPTHCNPLELFCVDCNKLVCVQCSVVSHRSCCQIMPVHKLAREKRSLLNAYKSALDIQKAKIKESIVEVKREKENVTFQKNVIKTMIKKRNDELMRLVAEETAGCLSRLDLLINDSHSTLDQDYESKNNVLTKLSAVSNSFEQLLSSPDSVVLDELDSLLEKREKVMTHFPNKIDIPVFKMEFKESSTLPLIGTISKESERRAIVFIEKSPQPTSSSSGGSIISKTLSEDAVASAQTTNKEQSLFFTRSTLNLEFELNTKTKGDKAKPSLRDITSVSGNVLVVTDYDNQKIKSFYRHGKDWKNSQVTMSVPPHSIAKASSIGNQIAVTLPKAKQIVLATVNPNIITEKIISTTKKFWGIAAIGRSNFAVSTCPGSESGTVSIINLEGQELKVFFKTQSILSNPLYLTSLSSGDIVASDCTLGRIIKIRQNGELLFLKDKKADDLKNPMGMSSDFYGAIFIADNKSLIVLDENGQVKNKIDLKCSKDQKIRSISISGKTVYAVTEVNRILIFKI